jgi:fructokinase
MDCVHYSRIYLINQFVLLIENPNPAVFFLRSNLFMLTCYGEALIDLIVSPYSHKSMRTDSQACLGGSVFNFCIASARQDVATTYLNPISSDSFGDQYRKWLQTEGVTLASRSPSLLPTSLAVVQLDAQGKARYAFHREAVADRDMTAGQAIAALPVNTTVLHTGCLMLVPTDWPTTRALLQAALALGAVVTVDANLRTVVCPDLAPYRASVLAACAMAHVVKVSDDDLVDLGAAPAQVAADPVAAARALLQSSQGVQGVQGTGSGCTTQLIALTLGAAGAWLVTRQTQVFVPSAPGLVVADTVGAGDSFFAALLAYLSRQQVLSPAGLATQLPTPLLQSALAHAVAAAGINVTRVGCNPATWAETVVAAALNVPTQTRPA